MPAKPIPEGYHTATPYLIMKNAARAIAFYKEAFGATEIMRLTAPGDAVGHAEIKVGDSCIMLADESPNRGVQSPQSLGGSTVSVFLYVEDVDALFRQATDAGAKIIDPVADRFWGDREGVLEDPFGHVWTIATHQEDISPEEINRRTEALMNNQSS